MVTPTPLGILIRPTFAMKRDRIGSSLVQRLRPSLPRTKSGTILQNKYELGSLLGKGSFAKVYRATAISSRETVAVKVIEKKEEVMEARLTAEVSSMKRVESHPNILMIHELMASRTKIYLVMELAVGGDLFAKILHTGRLQESLARKYFRQVASALHFCHQSGVFHRDVKPQNLLLDNNGDVKLCDFGLSCLLESSENRNLRTACGTPAFTAPEVFLRKGYDDSKADAWSCGVLLFFFLTGSLPFEDVSVRERYKRAQTRRYKIPCWVSRPARWLIDDLLDPNPVTRISMADVLRHCWLFSEGSFESGNLYRNVAKMDIRNNPRSEKWVNAFEIISMSSGLDLSGLFDGERREKRFTSEEPVEVVIRDLKKVGKKLGLRVEEGSTGCGNSRVGLVFKALQISEKLLVVEVKLEAPGFLDTSHWQELKEGLQAITIKWNT